MNYELKVHSFIRNKNLLCNSKQVFVALSGGADSVCLLSILHKLRNIYGYNLSAIHVHHGIRGDEADRDEEFCKKICSDLNIFLKIFRENVPDYAKAHKLGLEEAARILRYNCFSKVLEENADALIAIAHNQNDNAETFIFNLLRGSGLRGLCGLEIKRDRYIRPLLCLQRSEIEEYLKENNLSYVTDSTNFDTAYSRNKIRQEVIPKFQDINNKSLMHISQSTFVLNDLEGFVKKSAKKIINENLEILGNKSYGISIKCFDNDSSIVNMYILFYILEKMEVPLKDWSKKHFSDIESLCNKEGGSCLDLPYRVKAKKSHNMIIFTIGE